MSTGEATPSLTVGPTSTTADNTPAVPAPNLLSVEGHAMKLCMLGSLPNMPRSLDLLCDAGYIDEQGTPTVAGKAAWAAHVQEMNNEACRNNVLPYVNPETIVALGRLAGGEKLRPGDPEHLRAHEGFAVRGLDGWKITEAGRRIVALAHMRAT